MEFDQKYPVLKDHIVAVKIKTSKKTTFLIYDNITGKKKFSNKKIFNFLELATGALTFKEILDKLFKKKRISQKKAFSELYKLMNPLIIEGVLFLSQSPHPRSAPSSITAVHHLQNIYFELTRKCNLSCKHCYTEDSSPREDELELKEIYSLIDQMARIGVLSITFTGGEPLLHPHIFNIMEYARKKHLSILLFTNGTQIIPRVAKKLQNIPVYKVAVSVDGADAHTHDTIRGVEGAFQKTLRAIILLKNFDIVIQVNICLSRTNYHQFEDMLFLMKHLGVTEFHVRPVTFTGRNASLSGGNTGHTGKNADDLFITPVEYLEAVRVLHDFQIRELHQEEKREIIYSSQEYNCGVGRSSLTVQSDGTIIPCPFFGRETALGSIREHTLLDIWNDSPLLNSLRSVNVFETHPCKDCQFAGLCKGGCIGEIYRRTGRISCYDPYSCAFYQASKQEIDSKELDELPPQKKLSPPFV